MTQHQCRHSHCSTAPKRAPVQPVPSAREPVMAKPTQFGSKPQCRHPLHPVKRGAATDHRQGSLPSAVKRNNVQGSTQVPRSTDQRQGNTQVGGCGAGFEPDSGGITTKREMNTRMPPLACA